MASDVANTKKQVIKTLDPISNLTFDVSFRRLRVSKNRAATLNSGPQETQPEAQSGPSPTDDAPRWRFPLFNRADGAENAGPQQSQGTANDASRRRSNSPRRRFPFGKLQSESPDAPDAASPNGNGDRRTNVSGQSLPFLGRPGGAENSRSQSPQPGGAGSSSAMTSIRRLPFFRRQDTANAAQEEAQPEPDVKSDTHADEDQPAAAEEPAIRQQESGLVNHTVLTVDESGSIRRLDGPCPQQEFFSVGLSISWQREVPSRLQVPSHHRPPAPCT